MSYVKIRIRWYNIAYYVKDVFGNIYQIFDEDGTKVAEYEYDAWGNCTVQTNVDGMADLNPFRYRGYYMDIETGYYYCNYRYYSPELRRFLSPDSIDYLDPASGLNLYVYCMNNPIMFVDPSGHDWEWSTFWTGLFMVGIAIAAIALSVTTFGAGMPLAMSIVAGVTLGAGVLTGINGVATMIEAGTDYNFVRDGLFNEGLGLSDSAYDIYAGITEGVAAVGSMILGFYHTTGQYKAAKYGQKYLGPGYKKAGYSNTGAPRYVSKDGLRQMRFDTPHMYKGETIGKHMNLEFFKGSKPVSYQHVLYDLFKYWIL